MGKQVLLLRSNNYGTKEASVLVDCLKDSKGHSANQAGEMGNGDGRKSFPLCDNPAAGGPLYKAQKSDFLKRKVANLREYWRIWRNCAKKYLRKFNVCVDACVEITQIKKLQKQLFCAIFAHASTHAQKMRDICA